KALVSQPLVKSSRSGSKNCSRSASTSNWRRFPLALGRRRLSFCERRLICETKVQFRLGFSGQKGFDLFGVRFFRTLFVRFPPSPNAVIPSVARSRISLDAAAPQTAACALAPMQVEERVFPGPLPRVKKPYAEILNHELLSGTRPKSHPLSCRRK